MAGLILLTASIALTALLIWISGFITSRLAVSFGWKTLLRVLIVIGVPLLLVLDELVGKYQFDALCDQYSEFEIGVIDPAGRTARFKASPERELLRQMAIPIYRTRISYFDNKTEELIVAFERFEAQGGRLTTYLGMSEGNHPLVLSRATCSPESKLNEWVAVTLKFEVLN